MLAVAFDFCLGGCNERILLAFLGRIWEVGYELGKEGISLVWKFLSVFMKTRFLILFLAMTAFSKAQGTSDITFAQVYYEKAWRIIDTNGNFMLSQKYGVGPYQNLCLADGLALSFSENKFGFTDFKDQQIIPNKYDAAQCFEFGFAAVAVGQKWGIINREDKFIVEPEYDYAGNFGPEGLAGLIQDGKLGFADTAGKIVIPFQYHWIPSFNSFPNYPIFTDGLIAIIEGSASSNLRNGKIGFMNTAGKLIIEPQYDLMGELPIYINGKATVFKDRQPIVIDTFGNELFKTGLGANGFFYFVGGFATIYAESGHQGIIAEDGTIILAPKYNGVNPFSEGFAAVQIDGDENGVTSGFVNKNGEFVFDKRFGFVQDFHEGLAAVEVKGKWGYIDTTGNFIIEPQFEAANDFYNGIAIVGIKKGQLLKYGFIDKAGKFVLEPVYNEANEFQFGLAPVKIGNRFGYINIKGEIVIKPKFDNAFGFQKEQIGGAN